MRQLKIAVDGREAVSSHPTGKGIWVHHVLEELQRRPEIKLSTISYLPSLLRSFGEASQLSASKRALWHFSTARKLRQSPPDLYFSPTSYIVPYLLGSRIPCIPVIHDLIAFDDEPHDRKAKMIERLLLPKILRTAAHICAVSESTKTELLHRFPFVRESKITVVYGGPSLFPYQSTNQPINHSKYILSIATLCPRKNQLRLIEAYADLPESLKKEVKLLLVGGRGWHDGEIVQRATRTPGVEWRGYLPQEEVQQLLNRATVFAYPSLKEGFGIPVLGALQLGVPTLTSNRSSLAEIAGSAALLVDPESVPAITGGLEHLLTDDALRRRLCDLGPARAATFTWERTVDLLLGACEKALPRGARLNLRGEVEPQEAVGRRGSTSAREVSPQEGGSTSGGVEV